MHTQTKIVSGIIMPSIKTDQERWSMFGHMQWMLETSLYQKTQSNKDASYSAMCDGCKKYSWPDERTQHVKDGPEIQCTSIALSYMSKHKPSMVCHCTNLLTILQNNLKNRTMFTQIHGRHIRAKLKHTW